MTALAAAWFLAVAWAAPSPTDAEVAPAPEAVDAVADGVDPAATAARDDALAAIAPEETSHRDGPFGVLFVPRYADLADAAARGPDDVRALSHALPRLDAAARGDVEARLRDRLGAVRHWRRRFAEQVSAQAPGSPAHERLSDVLHRLAAEASTLETQRALLGALPAEDTDATAEAEAEAEAPSEGAPARRAARGRQPVDDLVVFGQRTVIHRDMHVRDAVVLGNDLVVEGLVAGDAVALGGDVFVADGARIDGDAVALGGRVSIAPGGQAFRRAELPLHPLQGTLTHLPARPQPPKPPKAPDGRQIRIETHAHGPTAVPPAPTSPGGPGLWGRLVGFLAFAGAGVLTVGLVPGRVTRVARSLETHPVRAVLAGLLLTVSLLLASLLFAITLVGLPVSFVLLGLLGLGWLLGFVGLCQAIGDQLPGAEGGRGRWLAFLVGAIAVSLVGLLPWVGTILVVAASVVGTGAAFASNLGASPRT